MTWVLLIRTCSAHQNLFCMQNIMDDCRVEQVKMEDVVKDMSVHLHQLESVLRCLFLMNGPLSSPPSSRASPLSLLLGKPVCDRMQLTNLLPLPSLQDSMSYVPNSRDLESALTLLSLQEDHCLPSPPLSPSPAPPPSPLPPSTSRSIRGVGVDSPPSGRMGVKYLKTPYSRKTGLPSRGVLLRI
jgi:hypothetical protein